MKRTVLTGVGMATVAALAWHGPAMADDSVEERLAKMEQRIEYLEERVASQDQVIVEKDRQISALSGMEDGWFNRIEIGGAIELEVVSERPYEGESTSSADLGTAELSIGAAINESVSGGIVIEHDDDDIVLAEAVLTYAPEGSGFSVTGGSQGLPFGVYDTNLVSDPLTMDLGDTGQVSVVIGGEAEQFNWSAFAFKGDHQVNGDDRIEGFGAAAGYAVEGDGAGFGVNLSWISDIADADGFDDARDEAGLDAYADHVAGMGASAQLSLGDATLLGEYVTALDQFGMVEVDDPNNEGQTIEVLGLPFGDTGAEPSAWMFELAYGFALGDRDATFAVGYQTSDEAQALGLPESRVLGALSVDVMENVGLALEWKRDEDYGTQHGGTGEDATTITSVLSAEF